MLKIYPNAQSQSEPLKQAKRNLLLCYMQLGQTIPVIVHNIATFVFRVSYSLRFIRDDKGQYDLAHAYSWTYVSQVAFIFGSLAIDMHFYLFLLCGQRFRSEFVKRFRKLTRL